MRGSWLAVVSVGVMAGGARAEDKAPVRHADFVDASRTITVRIKQCAPTSAAQRNTATCAVDDGFVLIGGGAEILHNGEPGALITASFPDDALTTWTAASKDHDLAYRHQLSAYAVGLKLAGVSAKALRGVMVVVNARSNPDPHPSVAARLPRGFKLIGGGARANWIGDGQLLTVSQPGDAEWFAASKDHEKRAIGTVDAFAIGIPVGAIAGFGAIDTTVNEVATQATTGYGETRLRVPAGWMLTSVGGAATYHEDGRMLSDLIPLVAGRASPVAGATVRSKDHEVQDSGTTTAYVVVIRKR